MHAHVVLAHPKSQSFNAHLADVTTRTLASAGWTTSVSDLYRLGFDPCERVEHYASPSNRDRFDVQAEQRHAAETGTVPADVAHEIAALDRADLVVLQYPMWWHLPLAMLKGWFDRVFQFGEVYTGAKRFERDLEATLMGIDDVPVIPFNTMAEWGVDGRIVPEAPVHSAFVRRRQHLALE